MESKITTIRDVISIVSAMISNYRAEVREGATDAAVTQSLGAVNALTDLRETLERNADESKPAEPQKAQILLESEAESPKPDDEEAHAQELPKIHADQIKTDESRAEGQEEDREIDDGQGDGGSHEAKKEDPGVIVHHYGSPKETRLDDDIAGDPSSPKVQLNINSHPATVYFRVIESIPNREGLVRRHRDYFRMVFVSGKSTQDGVVSQSIDADNFHFPASQGAQYPKIDRILTHVFAVDHNASNMFKYRHAICKTLSNFLKSTGYVRK